MMIFGIQLMICDKNRLSDKSFSSRGRGFFVYLFHNVDCFKTHQRYEKKAVVHQLTDSAFTFFLDFFWYYLNTFVGQQCKRIKELEKISRQLEPTTAEKKEVRQKVISYKEIKLI